MILCPLNLLQCKPFLASAKQRYKFLVQKRALMVFYYCILEQFLHYFWLFVFPSESYVILQLICQSEMHDHVQHAVFVQSLKTCIEFTLPFMLKNVKISKVLAMYFTLPGEFIHRLNTFIDCMNCCISHWSIWEKSEKA